MISFGTCKRIGRRQESSVNEAPKKSEHPCRHWVGAARGRSTQGKVSATLLLWARSAVGVREDPVVGVYPGRAAGDLHPCR